MIVHIGSMGVNFWRRAQKRMVLLGVANEDIAVSLVVAGEIYSACAVGVPVKNLFGGVDKSRLVVPDWYDNPMEAVQRLASEVSKHCEITDFVPEVGDGLKAIFGDFVPMLVGDGVVSPKALPTIAVEPESEYEVL